MAEIYKQIYHTPNKWEVMEVNILSSTGFFLGCGQDNVSKYYSVIVFPFICKGN